ncbi:MAG: hypothetical protein OQK75_09530 [Gammaproteobacteria bacterium]|nr:hypothetical protein [Gammaproteobacteria bacterium]MCW8987894.1 hypothetical protein [Gammaproteobacteria bacterium]
MKLKLGSWSLTPYFIAVMLVGLQACGGGGGGDTPPPPPANTSLDSAARGYYEGIAIIDVAAAAGGDLTISNPDLKAIITENEFNIIYKGTQNLLYKGTFTEVTATTFKATIRVYRAGDFIATAEIANGTIDAGVSFKGTITGTGAYTTSDYANSVGDIELTYNNANSLAPPTYIAGKEWQDARPTGAVSFNGATNAAYVFAVDGNPYELNCDVSTFDTTDVVNEQTGRIRSFITAPLSACITSTIEGTQLKGYLTNYNGGGNPDDRMLVIVSDDNYAYVGILPCSTAPCI